LAALLGLLVLGMGQSARAAVYAAESAERFDRELDRDGNGIEDLLDQWRTGQRTWQDLRNATVHRAEAARDRAAKAAGGDVAEPLPSGLVPAGGSWQQGGLRVICLGAVDGQLQVPREAAGAVGLCRVIHSLDFCGGVTVLALDEPGLAAFLDADPDARVLLDRDGVPALDTSRTMVGADQAMTGYWQLGDDWSATVAILDSGCDTAHGDLGDYADDNIDGPPPAVGDVGDWYPADSGWPLFAGYKVVGWHDVTDDFPEAQGPWDYHHHGTALASVVAGAGTVDPAYRGMAPAGRLTIVKFYDFDEVWHSWAGDFLAACAWTLENRDLYRVRTVLAAVNWDVDAGIADAMSAFLDAGIVPVGAMGNYGDELAGPGYPSFLWTVLTAGSVDDAGAVAAYSGRGYPGQGNPDLLAPGGGVLQSGGWITVCDNEPNDSYSGRQGTSLAAAHTAGAVYLLDEALASNGLVLPADRRSALTRMALLKATACPVEQAENAAGTGHYPLPSHTEPDEVRGWGLLRVDAAVQAMLQPLMPGRDQLDTLSMDWERPVAARRLAVSPGVRYLIEAVPAGGLDVTLEIVDPRWLEDDPLGSQVQKENSNGPGISEFMYYRPNDDGLVLVVVKRVYGSGPVTIRLREADDFTLQGGSVVLPGRMSGAPNAGQLSGDSDLSLVVPSFVTVDFSTRSLNVLDVAGNFRLGWPVFLFPHPSSQGGLTQPLVWNIDGSEGDEIVAASRYGSVYFFAGNGAWQEVALSFNLALSTPVGVVTASGERRVVVVDDHGVLRGWASGPTLRFEQDLDHDHPLSPCVGQLAESAGEELLVAFGDGWVGAFDADGVLLPGWPVDLGVDLDVPPVLCDLDDDGLHEVVLPVHDTGTNELSFRILENDGQPGSGDGTVLAPAGGGQWLGISSPVVVGRYGTGDLQINLAGLTGNGLAGDQSAWNLQLGAFGPEGAAAQVVPGFRVESTTSQGVLTLDNLHLPAPIAWNLRDGTGTEAAFTANVHWHELLYGFTSIPGSATAWYSACTDGRPTSGRQPLRPGGPAADAIAGMAGMILPLESGVHLRIDVVDDVLGLMPVEAGSGSEYLWRAARGDARNTGAYPLAAAVAPVQEARVLQTSLSAYPNPGSGQFSFRFTGQGTGESVHLQIFDLRGRRVRELESSADEGIIQWDGADGSGRAVSAGTYLAVARRGDLRRTTRVVLTR